MNLLEKSQTNNLTLVAVRMVSSGGGAETSFKNLAKYIEREKGITLHDLCFSDFKRSNNFISRFYSLIIFIVEIRRRSLASDRVFACVEGAPFLLMFIATLGLKKPVFLWLHCEPSVYVNFISAKNRFLMKLSIYLSKNIICASPWFALHYKEMLIADKSIHFLPNFVNDIYLNTEFPLKSTQRTRFLYVGSLSRLKNIGACFDFLLFKSNNSKLTFDIYGDGPEKKSLLAAAKKLPNFSSISFKGHVNIPWKSSSSNSILLVPSHTEALPMVIVEALAWGIPVIVNKYKGHDFFSSHEGIVEAVNFHLPAEVHMAVDKINSYSEYDYRHRVVKSLDFLRMHFNNQDNLKDLIAFSNSCN